MKSVTNKQTADIDDGNMSALPQSVIDRYRARRIETDKARKNYVNEFVEKHVLTNSVATDMFFEELSKYFLNCNPYYSHEYK